MSDGCSDGEKILKAITDTSSSDRDEVREILRGENEEGKVTNHKEILNFYRQTIVPLEDSGAVLIIGSRVQLDNIKVARYLNELESKISDIQELSEKQRKIITDLERRLKSTSENSDLYRESFWKVSDILDMPGSPSINNVHEEVRRLYRKTKS